ncbi:ArsR/SmtB family transcription factor [Sporomusa malonica]|uniref:Transcriptional regulator, ArsR family n=1 Tax=Sporomusa malonica TaxID=112901 RepID=A0A1W1YF95_9FIRM|nr:metalloregulator ArsR/SmtB family transcription factor [Sporomusa malonica]SMC34812.1 transcriptional regulator, ArsR family [Sporomusa malonica]
MKKVASIYKALGDETRLEIIKMLYGKELCVCDIIDACDKSQPAISHHLKILKQTGLLEDRREGKWIFYRINYENLKIIKSFIDDTMKHETELVRCIPCSPNRML